MPVALMLNKSGTQWLKSHKFIRFNFFLRKNSAFQVIINAIKCLRVNL